VPTSTTTTPRPRPELTSHDEYAIAVVGLGGIGSGAIYWAARRFGPSVVGLERFELGHERGASQDHSRIIRLSYHRPEYVRFAHAAFAAWADVEDHAGTQLVFRTGGLDLYPEGAFNWIADYVRSLDEAGDSYQWLDASETIKRWPQWNISDDVRVMFQDASGFVAADTANDVHRRLARELGATLLENTRVLSIRETGGMYELASEDAAFRAERVIITSCSGNSCGRST
jgi:sarcosine oxidase